MKILKIHLIDLAILAGGSFISCGLFFACSSLWEGNFSCIVFIGASITLISSSLAKAILLRKAEIKNSKDEAYKTVTYCAMIPFELMMAIWILMF